MGEMDRYRWMREQLARDKFAGPAARVTGDTFHVVPGASAAHITYAKSVKRNISTSPAEALEKCVDGRGDAIVLWPGDHTVSTASLAMSKAGVKIFGPEEWLGVGRPGLKPSATLTTDIATDEIMNVTAADCGIYGVTLIPITQSDGLDLSAAADRFVLKNCFVDLFTPAVHTSTIGVTLAAADDLLIDGCTFVSDGAQGNAIVATGAIRSRIQDCLIYNTAGTWASAIICGAATTGLFIIGNRILSYGTALTVGVNGTGATIASGVQCIGNQFGSLVTVSIDNFDAGECELAENYHLGIGATDGGVLITAIT
jgi:hypothetical protein